VIANPQTAPMALNFVVDAFEQLATYVERARLGGKISNGDRYLSSLKVYHAYEDPNVQYNQYLELLGGVFGDYIQDLKLEIMNFDDFMNAFMSFMRNGGQAFPFTKTGYIKSRRSGMGTSGLVIEIADLDYNNDQAKIDKFVKSPNWSFFVNACNAHGFAVDASAPWRLMADLDSVIMQDLAGRYGAQGAWDVLERSYRVVHGRYYRTRFTRDLLKLYTRFQQSLIVSAGVCTLNTSRLTVKRPASYTLESLQSQYPGRYFLAKYCEVRLMEDENQWTESEKERLIENCVRMATTRSVSQAMAIFERIVNKPFDYQGSISYIIKQEEAISESGVLDETNQREIERQVLRLQSGKQ
jgi:hypothetical protein